LSWPGFFIENHELPEIVNNVMLAWNVHRDHT
jgi:hypothetical protein